MLFWHAKSYFDIRTDSKNRILTLKILVWHSNWVGKCFFDIPIFTFELSRKIVFWHSKSYFDIRNPILTFELSRKILFWHTKSYFDIRTESENRILTFEIVFWQSIWVGKSYFDNRTETEYRIFTFEISFDIRTASEIVNSYFDIRKSKNAIFILTFELSAILTFKILFLKWVGKSYFDIQNSIFTLELSPILTFELSRKIVFWRSKSYFDIRSESENRILTFKILLTWVGKLFWYTKSYFDSPILTFELGKSYFNIVFFKIELLSYFDIRTILTFELSRKIIFWHSKS